MSVSELPSLGKRRLKTFTQDVAIYTSRNIAEGERILDYGCGRGAFLRAAREAGLDVRGVECNAKKHKLFRQQPDLTADLDARFIFYDGNVLPFASDHFDYVYSWYVLEHVKDLSLCLREITRVLKPGGLMCLYSQDARDTYEAHVKIPWPPFLPKPYIASYLEEWKKGDVPDSAKEFLEKPHRARYLSQECFYITSDQVVGMLEFFGMRILHASVPDTHACSRELLHIDSAEEAQNVARYMKERFFNNEWKRPKEQLRVYAYKKG